MVNFDLASAFILPELFFSVPSNTAWLLPLLPSLSTPDIVLMSLLLVNPQYRCFSPWSLNPDVTARHFLLEFLLLSTWWGARLSSLPEMPQGCSIARVLARAFALAHSVWQCAFCFYKCYNYWGTRVAQSDKPLTLGFCSSHDLMAHGFEPYVDLFTVNAEPAWDSLSHFLSAPPLLVFSLSLSLSLSQNK